MAKKVNEKHTTENKTHTSGFSGYKKVLFFKYTREVQQNNHKPSNGIEWHPNVIKGAKVPCFKQQAPKQTQVLKKV